jgi:NO-binding membrane sensor protein with MHYT domain
MTSARWALRAVGAVLLAMTAYIHFDLWHESYRYIPNIGSLFIANAIVASLLALAVLVAPGLIGRLAALAGAGLEGGTVIGLAIAVNHHGGLFGYSEMSSAKFFWLSVGVEIAGAVVLAGLGLLSIGTSRRAT